jgi:glycosyltransferase involved in cell wall biosynthesis
VTPDRLRILTVLPAATGFDGLQRSAYDLASELAQRGHRIDVVHGVGGHLEGWEVFASSLETVRIDLTPRTLYRRLPAIVSYPRRARARGYDIVHCHRLDLLNFSGLVSRAARAALVFQPHNIPPPWFQWGNWRVPGSRRIHALIATSRFEQGAWSQTGMPADVGVVVPRGMNLDSLHVPDASERAAARARIGIEPDRFVIAFVGRTEREKGLHVLMRAFSRYAESDPQAHLLVRGTASSGAWAVAESYLAECRAGVDDRLVTWLPEGDDIRLPYEAADLVVLPSVVQETSGRVVAEALAMGLPVIASRVGGVAEQLEGLADADELLVPPGDATALAARIESVRSRLVGKEEAAARFRRHVERHKLLQVEVDLTERELQRLAGGGSAR